MVLSLERFSLRRYGIRKGTDVVVNITTGKILKQHSNKGYMRVSLYTDPDNVMKIFRVHRLVWLAHKGSFPKEVYTIDHIDRNPRNNHISNLQLATKKQQIANRKVPEKYRKKIEFIPEDGEELREFLLEGETVIVTSKGNTRYEFSPECNKPPLS